MANRFKDGYQTITVPADRRVKGVSIESHDGVEFVVIEVEDRPVERKTLAVVAVER